DETTNPEDQAMAELADANPVVGVEAAADSPRAERIYRAAIEGKQRTPPRRTRVAAFAGGLAAIVAITVGAFALSGGADGGNDSAATGNDGGGQVVENPDEQPGGDDSGAAGGGLSATCIGYSVEQLQLRQFAFAGTVTAIDETEGEFGPMREVTFAVEE